MNQQERVIRAAVAAWVRRRLRTLSLAETDLASTLGREGDWLSDFESGRIDQEPLGWIEAWDMIEFLGANPGEVLAELTPKPNPRVGPRQKCCD
jgi:hypothetical protein